MVQWRTKLKWRLIYLAFGLFIGAYLTFSTAVLKGKYSDEREAIPDENPSGETIHYNLPSLDDILKSMVDLDFQKVVSNYKADHEKIPESTPKVNVVIASTWRSGSTLLGEIVSSHPGVFYHYEPLMSFGMTPIHPDVNEEDAFKLLKNLLSCQYEDTTSYLKHAYSNPDIFRRNERLWKFCSGMPRFKCYMSDILDRLCSIFPIQIMKIVRARLSSLSNLLDIPNTKIIWLVRDPRATMSSRLNSVDWCTDQVCSDPNFLCNDLNKDYMTYLKLKKQYPNNIMVVRYEDLARRPKEKSEEILHFIGLELHPKVEQYLDAHLSEDVEVPWSTIHDAQKRLGRWMKITPWEEVVLTQYKCRHEIDLLGYRAFDSETDYNSGNAVRSLNINLL